MGLTISVLILLVNGITPTAYSGEANCPVSSKAIPLCSVLADPDKYDGKEIIISGLSRMVVHGSILMSPECGETYVNMRGASDYKADKHASAMVRSLTKKDRFQSVAIILRGTFRAAHQGQCFGQNCLPFEIKDHELLCAAQPK